MKNADDVPRYSSIDNGIQKNSSSFSLGNTQTRMNFETNPDDLAYVNILNGTKKTVKMRAISPHIVDHPDSKQAKGLKTK